MFYHLRRHRLILSTVGPGNMFFFILAGLSLFPVVGGVLSIPPEPSKKDNGNRRIDWMGAFLITAGLSLFSFALTQSGLVEKGWRTPCKSSYI